ncbi:MAG: hypothetical protein AAF657_11195 [Acidobacteriota bacterium]
MPSYRFCRPDDIPYLVRAVNECYDVHFPDEPPLTLERFRAEMKAIDLWPSNCMVASSDAGPIAVLIGTKRADEVSVLRIGLRPGHERQGHGAHILTSLSQKLSVLGPERLVVEIPRALPGAEPFFAACDYTPEAVYTDYLRAPAPVDPVPAELVMPTTVDELDDHGLLDIGSDVAWERRRETLLGRKEDDLEGFCIASPERVEACLLYRESDDGKDIDIPALIARESPQRELFLGLLLRHLAGRCERPLRLPKLVEGEVPATVLTPLRFKAGAQYLRLASTATPV